MLPVLTKSLLQYGVEEAIDTISIVTGRGKRAIEDHFDRSYELEHQINGTSILIPEIFEILRETKPGKGGEIQITDALLTLSKQDKVLTYKFDGKRFDCDSIDGFAEATNHLKVNSMQEKYFIWQVIIVR